MSIIRFLVLIGIKLLASALYRFDAAWFGEKPQDAKWSDIRLAVILNHTSLLEPIFAAVLPVAFLWRIASRGMFPAADLTMNRPIVGRLFRILSPQVITLTRKRDESWQQFLEHIDPNSIMLFLPEGRMKRANGLDKHGRPMTVRGGIVDVLQILGHGKMLIAVSSGLHDLHVGKQIKLRLATVDIAAYLQRFSIDGKVDTKGIIGDLEKTRDHHQGRG